MFRYDKLSIIELKGIIMKNNIGFVVFIVVSLFVTGCSEIKTTEEDKMEVVSDYCKKIGEELEDVRINTHGDKQYICTVNIVDRKHSNEWLSYEEVQQQIVFLNFKD
jgi:hypothetical protein